MYYLRTRNSGQQAMQHASCMLLVLAIMFASLIEQTSLKVRLDGSGSDTPLKVEELKEKNSERLENLFGSDPELELPPNHATITFSSSAVQAIHGLKMLLRAALEIRDSAAYPLYLIYCQLLFDR